jgi:ubiquitin-associated SH3 domain-containing protein
MMNAEQFIIYACPVGELGQQINLYFQKSKELCGENTAHHYMPHCSLTGFFNADQTTIHHYLNTLDKAYHQSQDISLDIKIVQMMFKPNWHGLELKASGLKNLIAHFVEIMNSQPIEEKIRLKEWLHLSFAYNFQPQHHDTLKTLAEKMINPQALTQWELRFYHKYPDWTWTCLQSWLL